jgi:hypothetical protein
MKYYTFILFWLTATAAEISATPPILEKLRDKTRQAEEAGDSRIAVILANHGLQVASEMMSNGTIQFDTLAQWIREAMGRIPDATADAASVWPAPRKLIHAV